MNEVRGFKVFNPDWTCRGFQYEVGKIFEEDVEPSCCDRGFHFCENAVDCFSYYSFNSDNKVAEVIAYGDVVREGDKCCTNKIKIVREIPWQELLTIVNTGKSCTGLCNTGDCNTGDCNTGDCNTGNRNTGDWNTGNCNTGDCNTGDCNTGNRNTGNRNTGDWNTGNCNTGDCNTGDCNTGNRNTGNRNTGDWNKSSFNTGCFNTEESTIMLFNKPSEWTYRDWLNSDARYLLMDIPKDVVEWVYENYMTEDEKKAHPSYKTTGGYLKILDESECAQIWWDGLSEADRNKIKSIPNFDIEIFEQCTSIKIESEGK